MLHQFLENQRTAAEEDAVGKIFEDVMNQIKQSLLKMICKVLR